MMPRPNHRTGFSLLEITVVSGLLAVLAVLLSSAWVGMGRTAASLIGRSRLVQERDLAIAALNRDLGGGRLVASAARTGELINGRWLNWASSVNALLPSNKDLTLTYDGGTDSGGTVLANTVVQYMVATDPDPNASTLILKRKETVNGGSPTEFTVAKNVFNMTVKNDPDDATAVNVVLCFKYRTLTLTCDLTAKSPSLSSSTTLPWSIDHYTNP